jgi:hypothetical protein
MVREFLNNLNVLLQAIRRIISFSSSPCVSAQAPLQRSEDHAFVRESFDLFRKQSNSQSGRDEANHGGLSVGVLQNSRGETSFAGKTESPTIPSDISKPSKPAVQNTQKSPLKSSGQKL